MAKSIRNMVDASSTGFFFNAEYATNWNESVSKIELWLNVLELGQIFLEFCQNLAIFTGRNRILGKKYPFLTIFHLSQGEFFLSYSKSP